ncbi:hypothetical protein CDL60_21100 [Roseateles noduli]|nr:hypothetical protein CDL60_21100 [Roseateles noduli]
MACALSLAANGAANASAPFAWMLGDESCSATLITPRVAVSSYYCLGGVRLLTHADALVMRHRSTGRQLSGQAWAVLEPGPKIGGVETNPPGKYLALMVLDAPVPEMTEAGASPLPSYVEEFRLLRDREEAPTRLSAWVPAQPRSAANAPEAPEVNFYSTYVYRRNESGQIYSGLLDRPLLYRSVRALRAAEPARFGLGKFPLPPDDGPGVDVLGRSLQQMMNGEVVPDRTVDDILLTTVGVATDDITRVWGKEALRALSLRPGFHVDSPFSRTSSGSGLMASRDQRPPRLVGLVLSKRHLRLSAFWPAIHEALLKRGLTEDASFLARRVLGQPDAGPEAGAPRIGDVRHHHNPHSGRAEFFRRVALPTGGDAMAFPTNGEDNEQWEYLGTALPSRRAVVGTIKAWQPDERDATIGQRYVRFNGVTRQVEYFKLQALGPGGRVPELPSGSLGDQDWEYLGTDVRTAGNRFAAWTPSAPLNPLPGTGPALPAPAAAR